MEKRKLNDEVNRLLRDLVFQKLAMELAEIISGSWDLDGIWGMLQPIGKIRVTLWRRIRVTSSTAIDDAQWKFPMVGGKLLVSWEGLHWTAWQPYKGSKGPELACGIHKYTLKICQQRARVRLCEVMPKLSEQEAQFLVNDWHSAHSRLLLELEFKLINWEFLPWKLCGISCSSLSISQIMARECLGINAGTEEEQPSRHSTVPMFSHSFSHVFPRVFPWFLLCFSQGFPMVSNVFPRVFTCFFLRFSYCCPMVFPCFPLFFLLFFHGFPMVFRWFPQGFPMFFPQWFSHAGVFPIVFPWVCPCFSKGFPMVFPCFQCFFPWFPVFFPWFFDGFPCFSHFFP